MDLRCRLTNDLKILRVPGMIETLNLRLTEADQGALGSLELLRALVQDEVSNREANLSNRCTFENFDFRFNERALPPQTIRDLVTRRFLTQHQNIMLRGPPCPGK